jgi:hypothetical protein
MSDLLEAVIEAHGGLERWNQLETISARLVQGGALRARKGQDGVLDDVVVTASLHREQASHHPFGAAGRRSSFTPGRVAILNGDGSVIEALDRPRASFAGHTLETPWSTLQLAYFVGTAMWTYLTQPFTLAPPGFETTELAGPARPTTSRTTGASPGSCSPPLTGSFRAAPTARPSPSPSSSRSTSARSRSPRPLPSASRGGSREHDGDEADRARGPRGVR